MAAPREAEADDWSPIPAGALAVLSLAALWFAWQHFVADEAWVFLLDGVNLALHEAGHPIVGLVSDRLAVYGGTLFQLLFPALFAHHFRRRREALVRLLGLGVAAYAVWWAWRHRRRGNR